MPLPLRPQPAAPPWAILTICTAIGALFLAAIAISAWLSGDSNLPDASTIALLALGAGAVGLIRARREP
jgi:hypothetical protein